MKEYSIRYNSNAMTREVMDFVERWHYSKSCRSQKQIHVFTLHNLLGRMVGVSIYGQPISRNSDSNGIELRRFCLDDSCEKNTASFFLGKTLNWLRKNEFEYNQVVSFADPNKGHQGTIYKAANFQYDGLEKNNPRIILYKGEVYHTRQYYQKRNGQYDDVALELQRAVELGEAQIVPQERKHRFIYKLR